MKKISLVFILFFAMMHTCFSQINSSEILKSQLDFHILKSDSLLQNYNFESESLELINSTHKKYDFGIQKDTIRFNVNIPAYNKNNIFNSSYSKFFIPGTLISYGLITRGNKLLKDLDLSTDDEVQEHVNGKMSVDNYMQFIPATSVYALNLLGVKAKHNFRERTIVMGTSYLIMGTTVTVMKKNISVWRPDGSSENSFPSGHTATAFVGAHILFKEYKDVSPYIGIAGYSVAAATGTLRIINNRHWVSDVITGAGIGILSVEASYMLLPIIQNITGIKSDKNLIAAPSVSSESSGVAILYTF